MSRRVAITGIGAVTPLGGDAASTWAALVEGRSGIGLLDTFDSSTCPVRTAGLVRDFDLAAQVKSPRLRRLLNRAGGFGVAAALEAWLDAGVAGVYPGQRVGVSMAANPGRLGFEELSSMVNLLMESEGRRIPRQAPNDVVQRAQNTPLAVLAQLTGAAGPAISTNTACAASSHAVGEAFRRIQDGEAEVMIAGGCDALTGYLDVLGFVLLGALNSEDNDTPTRASRPFDRTRSGFVLGEGGVFMILEALDQALARGARIYCELVGYGSSLNAYRITDSPPDGSGAIEAMTAALADAAVSPSQVQYIVAHGTGTRGNDSSETRAIKAVFGDHAKKVLISSPKSMTGHLTAAAGSLNLLAATFAIRDGVAPPTINLEQPDPELDLDYVPNRARHRAIDCVLVNAFAFGGTNAALLVRR